jgi:hypothetical protein
MTAPNIFLSYNREDQAIAGAMKPTSQGSAWGRFSPPISGPEPEVGRPIPPPDRRDLSARQLPLDGTAPIVFRRDLSPDSPAL